MKYAVITTVTIPVWTDMEEFKNTSRDYLHSKIAIGEIESVKYESTDMEQSSTTRYTIRIYAVIQEKADKDQFRDLVKNYLETKTTAGKIESWTIRIEVLLTPKDTELYPYP